MHCQLEWEMREPDAEKLKKAIEYKLGPERIIEQLYMRSTNKTEAVHRRMQRLNPKFKTNRTTFHARNFHAVTLDTLGHKDGTIAFLRRLNLKVSKRAEAVLSKMERKEMQHLARTRTLKYKRRRVELRNERLTLRAQALKENKNKKKTTRKAPVNVNARKEAAPKTPKKKNNINLFENLRSQTIAFERCEVVRTTRTRTVQGPLKPNM